jgi:hypothetical protein
MQRDRPIATGHIGDHRLILTLNVIGRVPTKGTTTGGLRGNAFNQQSRGSYRQGINAQVIRQRKQKIAFHHQILL